MPVGGHVQAAAGGGAAGGVRDPVGGRGQLHVLCRQHPAGARAVYSFINDYIYIR